MSESQIYCYLRHSVVSKAQVEFTGGRTAEYSTEYLFAMIYLERLPVALFSAILTLLLGGTILFAAVLIMATPNPMAWVFASWMWKSVMFVAGIIFVLGMLGKTEIIESVLISGMRFLRLFYFFR